MENTTESPELKRMKVIALALLIIMGVIFLISGKFMNQYPWLKFVKAFSEAAMVGGLADWFAVVALFRHPMGIPIPHTAIIATKKDNLGRGLANFVKNNFLSNESIAEKINNLDVTARLESWLNTPGNARQIADKLCNALPDIINGLDDKQMSKMISNNLREQLQNIELAPLSAQILTNLYENKKHDDIFQEGLKWAVKLLTENKQVIQDKVSKEGPWYIPKFNKKSISNNIVNRADELIREINEDPNHEIR